MTEDTSVYATIPGFFIEPLRKDYSKEEAVAALEQSETPTQERGGMTFQ